jgi:F0F1-type ATP synthase assembly protein I
MAEVGSFKNRGKNGWGATAPRQSSEQAAWWQPAVTMFLRLSVWIVGPVIIALFLGKWLDKKYNSEPWMFLLCTGVAFLISMIGLIKNVLAEYRKIEAAGKADGKKDKNDK